MVLCFLHHILVIGICSLHITASGVLIIHTSTVPGIVFVFIYLSLIRLCQRSKGTEVTKKNKWSENTADDWSVRDTTTTIISPISPSFNLLIGSLLFCCLLKQTLSPCCDKQPHIGNNIPPISSSWEFAAVTCSVTMMTRNIEDVLFAVKNKVPDTNKQAEESGVELSWYHMVGKKHKMFLMFEYIQQLF